MQNDLLAIRFIPGTKISHDYEGDRVDTFSYWRLCQNKTPAIGIPAKQNRLLIVDMDVAGPTHKKDGREWWYKFSQENALTPTYTVRTPSGGFHFYYRLPEHINPDTFNPPGSLADGVDLKWNGWVGAPPTVGYAIEWGDITKIQEAPKALLDEIERIINQSPKKTYDFSGLPEHLNLHRPYSPEQLADLRIQLQWMQVNANLSYQEWRDGLFALKAGIDDEEVLDEFVNLWTYNKSYVVGDEVKAKSIVERAEKHGPIGPGTLFTIIQNARVRKNAPAINSQFTVPEILDRANIYVATDKMGRLKVEPTESNAGAIISALFDEQELFHDVRSNHFIFKGEVRSDAYILNTVIPMIQSPSGGLGLEKFKRHTIKAGLEVCMVTREVDPHLEYLKSLSWDGIPRIETFMSEYVGAEDSEYMRKVSMNFWVGLAGRGLNPGEKVDTMVVLEGHEGISKSSIVKAIAGRYVHSPIKNNPFEDLDELRSMHQSVLVELPELRGLLGKPAEVVQDFLSRSVDNIRGLFERMSVTRKRGFVCIGTTNNSKYLLRSMGIRRFHPVRIPPGKFVNIDAIKADRDLLFAEACHHYKNGYAHYEMPRELLDPVVKQRQFVEPLKAPVEAILDMLGTSWTVADVYRHLVIGDYIPRGLTPQIASRIEEALKLNHCVTDNGTTWRRNGPHFVKPSSLPADMARFF